MNDGSPVRTVTVEERRARLGRRHHLADRCPAAPDQVAAATAVETVVDDLVVLHATDPATVFLSLAARCHGLTAADVEHVVYDQRLLLRTLAMRRTLFVPTVETAGVVEASSSVGVAAVERKRLEGFLTDSGIGDPKRWLTARFADVAEALDDVDDGLLARQLSLAQPELATRIVMGAGTKYPVDAPATSRVLGLMAVEGHLVRGRPTGDWTSRLYRWHRRDRWWLDGDGPTPEAHTEDEASTLLLQRWIDRFGPATVADMKWWTGWTMTKTRKALDRLDTVEVALDGALQGQIGHVLADDVDPVAAPDPWVALLPSLDPTAMGWTERDWYLGDHRAELFDRNGNVGPTIWADGRIVGGWAQRPDGEVVTELLSDIGSDHQPLMTAEIERIQTFVGQTAVKPSFPTPLQKRLAAG